MAQQQQQPQQQPEQGPLPSQALFTSNEPAISIPSRSAKNNTSSRSAAAATTATAGGEALASRSSSSSSSDSGTRADALRCGPLRRLLHWNILDGGGSRIDGIVEYIKAGNFDLVTLNELNGFDKAELASLGKRTGLTHTLLLAKSRYHLGVLSRHPLKPLKHERGHDFTHGMLCVRVLGVALCVTHLNPHDVHKRAEEARVIIERHARREIDKGRPFMLVGDLNTLSALDSAAHDEASLPSKIRNGPYAKPLAKKFLNKARTAVDYTPMQVLLDAPLRDVGEGGGHSVPTKINADHMHFATLRLDYCLVSEAMLSRTAGCGKGSSKKDVWASLVRDDETDRLSDHFPLVVNFRTAPFEEAAS